MYQALIFKLDSIKSDIEILNKDSKKKEENVIFSKTINLSLFSLGYHYYIDRTIDALNITKNIKSEEKFYTVVNPFEDIISNYDDSLKNLTKHYLNSKKETDKHSTFYKYWEMLFLFFEPNNKDTFIVLNENKNADPIIDAYVNFKDKLDNGTGKDNIMSLSNPINIYKFATTFKTRKDITSKNKNNASLIIADGGSDENGKTLEQDSYEVLLEEIIDSLKVQAVKGSLILKLFPSFTMITLKLLYILSSFYEEVYIYKPYFSKQTLSEKYIICKNFKKVNNNAIKSLEDVLDEITDSKNKNKYVFDIYPDLVVPESFVDKFKFINTKLANGQQIIINDIVSYIKENNYFGDKYHMYRENQINATKWWVSNFYPPTNNLFEKNKEDLKKLIDISIEKSSIEENKLLSLLVK